MTKRLITKILNWDKLKYVHRASILNQKLPANDKMIIQ